MTGGSQQLRTLRRALRDGATVEAASAASGIPIAEARLHHADMIENPPPPEDFEPIRPTTKDDTMPQTARAPQEDGGGEYKRPDAAAAFKIYDKEIAPKKAVIAEKRGDLSDPYSRIKDQCHFPRRILDLIVSIEGEEDAKRDHLLLSLSEALRVRKLFMPRDLVTIADGSADAAIVPISARPKPQLATLAPHPADDSDLADGAGDGEFEATADELAAQEGRGKPKPGTGAAAIAAMKAQAEGSDA